MQKNDLTTKQTSGFEPKVSNERAELMNGGKFLNSDNQFFPRTHSAAIEKSALKKPLKLNPGSQVFKPPVNPVVEIPPISNNQQPFEPQPIQIITPPTDNIEKAPEQDASKAGSSKPRKALKLQSTVYKGPAEGAKAEGQDAAKQTNLDTIKEEKDEPKVPLEKQAQTKKISEKEIKPEKVEPKIEDIRMTANKFEEELKKLIEALKASTVPEALIKIKERPIKEESPPEPTKLNRGYQKKPTTISKPRDNNVTTGSFNRGADYQQSKPEQNQDGFRINRAEISEEEQLLKKKIEEKAGKWIQQQKSNNEPDDIAKKEIKINLNKITLDNFEVIKNEIYRIAQQKVEFTRHIADHIIENAWTQKSYISVYAKLCEFLGKADLYFTQPKEKKKNDFKIYLLQKIQSIFEENKEELAALLKGKKLEELTPEERSDFNSKKKQKTLGNVSFIGQLFLEKFIVIPVIRMITNNLVQSFLIQYAKFKNLSSTKTKERPHEDTLEALIKLYDLIGEAYEEKESKKFPDTAKSAKIVESFQMCLDLAQAGLEDGDEADFPKFNDKDQDELSLDDLFKIFNMVMTNAEISTRHTALIKNLLYRKENKWKATLAHSGGPKTIQQIHDEYEREQEEAEKRANQYYEDSRRKNYGKQGSRAQQTFQVSYEAKPKYQSNKSTERISELEEVKADESVSFRPQRGKKQEKRMTISHEELENTWKDIYKMVAEEGLSGNEDKIVGEMKSLAEKVPSRELAQGYFNTFYEGKLTEILTRIPLTSLMAKNNLITSDDFLDGISKALYNMSTMASDYPKSDEFFASVMFEAVQEFPDKIKLAEIELNEDVLNDEDGFLTEFYQEFLKKLREKLKNSGDLKHQIDDKDISAFAQKIRMNEGT